MSINIAGSLSVLTSHAEASGWFAQVTTHEPKAAPHTGDRMSVSIVLASLDPAPRGSGLANTSAVVVFRARMQIDMMTEPQDAIDVGIGLAAVEFMRRVSADFDLGGTVRNVLLLGGHGTRGLSFQSGYVQQGGTFYRAGTVLIPCIVNDVWAQSA